MFKRNSIAKIYDHHLKNLPILLPNIDKNNLSSFHLYVIKLTEKNKKKYDKIFKSLLLENINVNLHYLPVHLHPYYKKLGFKKGDFPNSEKYAMTSFSIPLFPSLDDDKFEYVVQNLISIINEEEN